MSELHERLTAFCSDLYSDGLAPHGVAVIIPTSDEDADLVQEYGNNPERLRRLIAQDGNIRRDLGIAEQTIVDQRGIIDAHETYIRELQAERQDPEHVLHLRGNLAAMTAEAVRAAQTAREAYASLETVMHECDAVKAERDGLSRDLQAETQTVLDREGTIDELRDALRGAMDVADSRGASLEALREGYDRLHDDLRHADEVSQAEHATTVRLCDEGVAMRERLLSTSAQYSAQRELRKIAEANYASCQESVGILAGELHRVTAALRTAEYRLATFGYRPQ